MQKQIFDYVQDKTPTFFSIPKRGLRASKPPNMQKKQVVLKRFLILSSFFEQSSTWLVSPRTSRQTSVWRVVAGDVSRTVTANRRAPDIQQHITTKAQFPLPEFTARVHGPSWRPVNSGAFFDTWVDGPSWRVSKNAPEFTGRELGPLTRAVNSGSGNRA